MLDEAKDMHPERGLKRNMWSRIKRTTTDLRLEEKREGQENTK